MAESPKLVACLPSVSSRNSFSSEEFRTSPIGRPWTHTGPSSPVRSSHSVEVPEIKGEATSSQGHPLKYLGAGRFFRPGSEDQSGWRRIRERTSWSKSFPRPFESRSAWPSDSQRDLLREAGDWLDIHFPVPDILTTEGDWQLPSSPFREDFSASSPRDSSRPTSSSSTTTKDDINGADEKIVYNERENKLRGLLDKMKRDFEEGRAPQHSRSARVRKYLKEIQAQNENQASIRTTFGQQPIELDASLSPQPIQDRTEDPSPDLSSLDDSSADDQFPYESARESLRLCESLEKAQILQPLPTIDLSRLFDDEFSAATARALNDLPDPSKSDLGIDTETAKTPIPTPQPNAQPDYFATGNSHHESPQPQAASSLAESTSMWPSTLPNRDSTASKNSSQALSEQISLSTSRSGEVSNEPRGSSIERTPHLENPPLSGSVFVDLENLVKASRRRYTDIRKSH